MRVARIEVDGRVVHARAEADAWVPIEDPYAALAAGRQPADAGAAVAAAGARLLPPADPRVLVGIAQNRTGDPCDPEPAVPVQAWLKSPRSIVATGEAVRVRRDAGGLVAEAEAAVVIARDTGEPTLPSLTAENAHEFVLGVTAVNDLSYPERTAYDERNFEAKGGDGSTPLGPWIDTEASIDALALALELDGRRVRDTSIEAMPVPVREALAYVVRWVRLGPGDVVMAGAPRSNHPAAPGQTVVVVVGDAHLETPLR